MKIEQIYTGCLAHGAYYILSGKEAAIVDPLREVDQYILRAKRDGATIKYVFETHFHADFVSGHLDLAKKTGATIVYGPTATPNFPAHVAVDGEEFKLGDITIKALHTPGHTLESTTYLLKDEGGRQQAIFSGDTLFLGDVGRPDLAQKTGVITKEDLAGMLFDSLRTKIMTLADDVVVYPGHGAGSACGKKMMNETVDTLGHQRKLNYALRENMTRPEFIKEVLEGLETPPGYFPENARLNKEGYPSIDEVLLRGSRALKPEEFELVANESDALVLDTRDAQAFAKGFIPRSVNIGVDGNFAPWVGALIPGVNQPLLIIAEPGRETEVVTRLARVGFDNVLGFLAGGFNTWKNGNYQIDTIESISASAFERRASNGNVMVVDVRKPDEYKAGHVSGSENIPLESLNNHLAEISREQPVYVYCAAGYRSMIACSILKSRGWNNIIDVDGGFKAISATMVPVTTEGSAKI